EDRRAQPPDVARLRECLLEVLERVEVPPRRRNLLHVLAGALADRADRALRERRRALPELGPRAPRDSEGPLDRRILLAADVVAVAGRPDDLPRQDVRERLAQHFLGLPNAQQLLAGRDV